MRGSIIILKNSGDRGSTWLTALTRGLGLCVAFFKYEEANGRKIDWHKSYLTLMDVGNCPRPEFDTRIDPTERGTNCDLSPITNIKWTTSILGNKLGTTFLLTTRKVAG
jgi:hypothetical protein